MLCHWFAIGLPLVCHWFAIGPGAGPGPGRGQAQRTAVAAEAESLGQWQHQASQQDRTLTWESPDRGRRGTYQENLDRGCISIVQTVWVLTLPENPYNIVKGVSMCATRRCSSCAPSA